jgi:cell division septation protein DedD
MNTDPRPRVTASQIIWIVACVVLITSLFLIGAWLFKPAEGAKDAESPGGPGGIQEQEVNATSFAPEGRRFGEPSPAQQEAMPPANALIPTPPALETRLPSQMAQESRPPAAPAATATKPPEAPPSRAETPKEAPPAAAAPAKPSAEPSAAEKEKPAMKAGVWQLQVAAVSDKRQAQELQRKLAESGFPSAHLVHEGDLYKVRIPYKDEGGARSAKMKLEGAGIKGTEGAWVVKPEGR